MPRFTALDERFAHQIPEPFPATVTYHRDWRESLFHHMHPKDRPGDVVILTLAHYPARGVMDSLQLGRVGAAPTFALHERKVDGDQDDFRVGPVTIDVEEPLKRIRMRVAETAEAPVAMDLTFTARTQPYGLRRGTMKAGHDIVWDQSHMFQSGRYDGWYRHEGVTYEVNDWVGQRDHSWGIRTHDRCPCWIWLAIQLPEGMLAVWHWEYPNGAIVFSDGCFAPADGSAPVPVTRFHHDLHWLDVAGNPTSYERIGDHVMGLAGHVAFTLEGGRVIEIEATGRWAQRYSDPSQPYDPNADHAPVGGGLCEMMVETKDGSKGTAIYEVTGQWHHKYFPLARGRAFPPHAYTPAFDERAR
ncbi:hypothetical protein OLX02_00650 [Novosphingobium sp. KCTC 2891]|uniref:hypothetical protein n=1 Tax=Novosphingobium sp. KCTC 2891 TaxID=2989730 RepID=UPI002221AED9|nr:hypothetical protein [Novosphingobium sp. KCTC 2891]MCW1381320.1 hypothetical protein [Novosphingobium sp. KCTC 2891]